MSIDETYLSEVRLFACNFAPKGWALCNGQLLPINQNQALFSLLGNRYGGDGQVNFALPDLRGRVPMHEGAGHSLGERAGEQVHTLTVNEMPAHTHLVSASASQGNDVGAGATIILASPLNQTYRAPSALTALASGTVTTVGGSQAHPNMQPYLTLNYCIALQGIFPSAS